MIWGSSNSLSPKFSIQRLSRKKETVKNNFAFSCKIQQSQKTLAKGAHEGSKQVVPSLGEGHRQVQKRRSPSAARY